MSEISFLAGQYLEEWRWGVAKTTFLRVRYQLKEYVKEHDAWPPTKASLKAWKIEKQKTCGQGFLRDYCQLVSRFIRWCVDKGYLLVSPIDEAFEKEFIGVKTWPKMVRKPTKKEVLLAIQKCDTTRFKFRNRALLETLYSTGLRIGEVLNLDLDDLLESGIRARCKGGKTRLVPIGKKAWQAILDYLRFERDTLLKNPSEKAVFIGLSGRRLSRASVSWMLKYDFGLSFTAHGFRHACASHMLEAGCDIRIISEYLGHEKISTTGIYARLGLVKVKEMLDRVEGSSELKTC